ncbi:MAG TPA: cupin domain-containing protein [Solirubrobacterales bacterium]|nr:cupin domain-containing protein [Solirubrobacterales bacterium]
MYVSDVSTAPKREVDGLVSHILLEEGDAPGGELSITWVDVEPGGEQKPHSHGPQQVYVITRGQGRMKVGDDERDVHEGEMVFIPPDTDHGIVNRGDQVLTYVSAATPAFPVTDLYDVGQLSLSP